MKKIIFAIGICLGLTMTSCQEKTMEDSSTSVGPANQGTDKTLYERMDDTVTTDPDEL